MEDYHDILAKFASFEALVAFCAARRKAPPKDFEGYEAEFAGLIRRVEADLVGEELAPYDVDAESIVVDGREYRRVLVDEPKRYLTSAGPVAVPRNLFRASGESKSICPLELRSGIIGGVASPRLGRHVCFLMAHVTSDETAEVFAELGVDGPSTCDRLPKVVSEAWEKQREHSSSPPCGCRRPCRAKRPWSPCLSTESWSPTRKRDDRRSWSENELRLYLLFVLAGDRNGVSFHHYDSICSILEIYPDDYVVARNALIEQDLIAFGGTRTQVLSLPERPVPRHSSPLTTQDDFERRDPATIRIALRDALGLDDKDD